MERLLAERGIRALYHFTQAENLEKHLCAWAFATGPVGEARHPGRILTTACASTTAGGQSAFPSASPTTGCFTGSARKDTAVQWAVLRLRVQVLLDCPCIYCWTNAGNAQVYNTPPARRAGGRAFLKMFAEREGGPTREEMQLPCYYPTDPQAEVLVFGRILPGYIVQVDFEDLAAYSRYRGKIPARCAVNAQLFRPRRDWPYWKSEAREE